MKIFWTLLTSLCLTFGLAATADAKRFGSGSFGKAFQTTPYKKAAPSQTPQKQQPAQNAGSRKGLMGGMLGGLLAGGLFAYLLGSGAFEGLQLMDILLIAGLIFIVLKLLKGRAQPQQREAWAGGVPPAQNFNADSMSSGGDYQQPPMNPPAGFDADAFTDGALQHYREVQQAWNKGDLSVIAEYVSPELYNALARQRQSMMVPPQTEILDLTAEIVRADHNEQQAEVSVLFRGRVKDELEKSEDGVFDVWHLERDLSKDDAPWLIVGIEAE